MRSYVMDPNVTFLFLQEKAHYARAAEVEAKAVKAVSNMDWRVAI